MSESYVNLHLHDTPLFYDTSTGYQMSFGLTHRQRQDPNLWPYRLAQFVSGVGPKWAVDQVQYIVKGLNLSGVTEYWHHDEQGVVNQLIAGGRDYFTGLNTSVGANLISVYDDYGRQWDFATRYPLSDSQLTGPLADLAARGFEIWVMTKQIYPSRRADKFVWDVNGSFAKLVEIYDTDQDSSDPNSLRTTLQYNNATYPNLITKIQTPFGRSATLSYYGVGGVMPGALQIIADAAALQSSFVYQLYTRPNSTDTDIFVSQMTTPYGTTTFNYGGIHNVLQVQPDGYTHYEYDSASPYIINRSLGITGPNQEKHLFLYRENSAFRDNTSNQALLASAVPTADIPIVPATTADVHFETTRNHLKNSFHWGPIQYKNTSAGFQATGNPDDLSVADYLLAHRNHYLVGDVQGGNLIVDEMFLSPVLSYEQDGSSDGTTPGRFIFYDYEGKITDANGNVIAYGLGNSPQKWFKAYTATRSDGVADSYYVKTDRNTVGGVIGTTIRRENEVQVAADQTCVPVWAQYYRRKVLLTICPGVPEGPKNLTFNPGGDQVTSTTSCEGYTESYTYDSYGRLKTTTSVQKDYRITLDYQDTLSPSGSTLPGPLSKITAESQVSTGSPTLVFVSEWTTTYNLSTGQKQIQVLQDPRGLTATQVFDALDRLKSVSYPDGTSSSLTYDRLDLKTVLDRHGLTTTYFYDNLRNVTQVRDALSKDWFFDRCNCGLIEKVRQPVSGATQQISAFEYDKQGQVKRRYAGDVGAAAWTDHFYDRHHRLERMVDSQQKEVKWVRDLQGNIRTLKQGTDVIGQWVYDIDNFLRVAWDRNKVARTYTPDVCGVLMRIDYNDPSWTTPAHEDFVYDARGLKRYTNMFGILTTYDRDERGNVRFQWGPGQSEVTAFTYTAAGDLENLTDTGNHTTRWEYDAFGRVSRKFLDYTGATIQAAQYVYQDLLVNDPNYGWKVQATLPSNSGVKTITYNFGKTGDLKLIDYPNSPDVTFSYSDNHQLLSMVDGASGTTGFSYDPTTGLLASEDGPWANDQVSYTYDTSLQCNSMTVQQPAGLNWKVSYGYDNYWRLQNMSSPAGSFTYQYITAASWIPSQVQNILLPGGNQIVRHYDGQGRVDDSQLLNGATVLDRFMYPAVTPVNNSPLGQPANYIQPLTMVAQRAGGVIPTGAKVETQYTFDNENQVKTASASDISSGGSPTITARLNEQYGYDYGSPGNLTTRRLGTGGGQQTTVFGINNALNQISTVNRSASVTPSGMASPGVTTVSMKLNGASIGNATVYSDKTFSGAPITLGANDTVSATATEGSAPSRSQTTSVTVSLPTTLSFNYDINGNLTSDGLRSLSYDDANQLVSAQVATKWKVDYVYDGLGRMRIRKEYTANGAQWTQTNETRFVYDGMLVVQERNAQNLPTATYTQGLDLGGTRDRAGGIGGLLAMTTGGVSADTYVYHADRAGNVSVLARGAQVAARYLYDPFGSEIGSVGPMAEVNRYRFSSKEVQPNSGLVYYGYRFYDPNLQRWLTRDPIEERGGINLYGFVNNSPINRVDPLGLEFSYWYGDADGLLHPAGSVPYLMGDAWWENLLSGFYNFVPFVDNALGRMLSPIDWAIDTFGNWAGASSGDPAVGTGVKNVLNLATVLMPVKCKVAGAAEEAGAANTFFHYSQAEIPAGQGLKVGSGVTSVGNLNAQEAMLKLGVPPPKYVYPVTLENPLDHLLIDLGTPSRNAIPSWEVIKPTPPGSVGTPIPVPRGN
ncbi:MAG: RHS repeat-associated core domain-containing protein [Verrucomicrobia bacterium]|nr:RHS repeat-associated core domain-containing protein [Verrucomicrobiota bacterium]